MNMAICAEKDTNLIFEQVLKKALDEKEFFDAILTDLIPALKDELIRTEPKSWWQFWK